MSDIKRRVKSLEKKLSINDPQVGAFIAFVDEGEADALPEPFQEWITCKQEKAKCGGRGPVHIAMLSSEKELKAREEQKATESNKKGEK